jgi:lambda family phage tail tape measure protein
MTAIRVELQLDDGTFTSRMLHAGQSVKQLETQIGQGVTSIKSMERESASFLRTLGGVTLAIGAASMAIGLLKGTANGLVGDLVRVNAEFERMNQVLRGMSNAADPIKDAATQVKYLRDFAMQAPFSLKGLTEVFVRMKATGIDPMAGAMRSLVDAVAASGGTEQQLQRASLAISQMSGKGVIQMEELRQQLGEAIPRATELMARSMGVTYADLVKKISTGMVSAAPALEALNREFERVFGGSAQAQMNTFNGLVNQTKTQFQNLALAAGENGFMDSLKNQLRDLNSFMGTNAAKGMAEGFGAALTSMVNGLRSALDWVVQFRYEIMTMGEMLAYALGGALVIGGISRLATGFAMLSANVVSLGQALVALTPSALAAARAQQAIAIAAGTATTATVGLSSAIGVLGFTVSRLLGPLSLIAVVATGVISFFDLFGSSAKKADESMRKFGATSNKEIANFIKGTQAMSEKITGLERDLAYMERLTPRGLRESSSLLKDKREEIAQLKQTMEERQRLISQRADEFQRSEVERNAQGEMRKFDEQERLLRRKYDIAQVEDRKLREEEVKKAKTANSSIEVLTQRQQARVREAQIAFYDETAKIYEQAMIDADKRINDARSKGRVDDVGERMKGDAAARLLEIRKQQETQRNAALGISMQPKTADESKLIEKGGVQLERIKTNLAEVRAELAGASGESARLAYELDKIKFKEGLDNPAIQKLIEQLKTAQAEYEALDKLMQGQKKLDADMDAALKRMRDRRFEIENEGASEADKFRNKVKRGDYYGWEIDKNGDAVRTAEALKTLEKLATDPETKKGVDNVTNSLNDQKKVVEGTGDAARAAGQTFQQVFANIGKTAVETFNDTLRKTAGIIGDIKSGVLDINNLRIGQNGFPNLQSSGVMPGSTWTSGGDFGKFIDRLTGVESGNDASAKNPNSTATGLGQFVASTWMSFMREVMPEAMRGRSQSDVLAMRNDPGLSRQATEWYARQNSNALQMNGFQPTDANLYLSHFLGPSGAIKTLRAEAGTAIRDIIGDDAYNANRKKDGGFVYGETAGAVIAEIQRRFGNALSITGQPASGSYNPVAENPGQNTASVELLKQQAAANKEVSASEIKRTQTFAEMEVEARKMTDVELAKATREAALAAAEATDKYDGLGKHVAAAREKIKSGRVFGTSDEDKNPDNPRFKEYIRQVEELDRADERVAQSRKKRAAADEAVKRSEALSREGARTNEDTRKRLASPNSPDPNDDQSRAIRRQGEERLRAIEEVYGRESDQYRKATVEIESALEADSNMRASQSYRALYAENQTAQRALMTPRQAAQAEIQELTRQRDEWLATTRATGEAKLRVLEEYNRKIDLAQKKVNADGPIAQAAKQWADIGRNMEQAFVGWIDGGIDAIAEFAVTGEMNFKKLFQSIAKDIAKMGMRLAMSQVMGGKPGAGGVGGAGKAAKTAMTGFPAAHTGGIIGGSLNTRSGINPGVFYGAPRFHTGGVVGGLLPGEVPIIAKEGEGVFTPEQMASMGGSNTAITQSVNVTVNASGGDAKQNKDLADQVGRAVQQQLRGMIGAELKQQIRPGGLLREAGR